MKELMIFENTNVEIMLNEKGEPLFELYSTAVALGYGRIRIVKGREYQEIQKTRIHNVLKNAEITGFPHGEETYLTEEMLYDFMLEARTDKCKKFRKWVTSEVLPAIRRDGGYLLTKEDDTEEELLARALIVAQRTLERKSKQVEILAEKNVELESKLTYKEAILEGVIGEISLAEKQQRISQIIRFGAKGRFQERYNLLYTEFDKKHHIDSKRRLDNAIARGDIKRSVNRMEYICKHLGMAHQLYEIAVKLFESDFKQLIATWEQVIA